MSPHGSPVLGGLARSLDEGAKSGDLALSWQSPGDDSQLPRRAAHPLALLGLRVAVVACGGVWAHLVLPARLTAFKTALHAVRVLVLWYQPQLERACGLRFADAAEEARFAERSLARLPAKPLMMSVSFGVCAAFNCRVLFLQSGSTLPDSFEEFFNYGAGLFFMMIIFMWCLVAKHPYGPLFGGKCQVAKTIGVHLSMVDVIWFIFHIAAPIDFALRSPDETFLRDDFTMLVDSVGIPFVMTVIPCRTGWMDFVATRLVSVSQFGPHFYTKLHYTLPLLGSFLSTYLYRRMERSVFEMEHRAARAMNRRLGLALCFLSHEVRNNVAPVQRIIADGLADGSDKAAAIVALETVSGILENVLTLAKLSTPGRSGGSEEAVFPHAPFQLRDLAHAAALVGARSVLPGVNFVTDPPQLGENAVASDVWVDSSRTALVQALNNLLSNACKFTSSGEVRLEWHAETRAIGADGYPGEVELRVRVSDTGRGIPPEQLASVLQEFGRVRTGRSAEEGTGLGLPLSKRLVESLGGTFRLDSTPGVGTTVSIALRLPRAAPRTHVSVDTELEQCLQAIDDDDANAGDVLVADDSRLCRMVMRRVVKRLGFSYKECEDGDEVLAEVRPLIQDRCASARLARPSVCRVRVLARRPLRCALTDDAGPDSHRW